MTRLNEKLLARYYDGELSDKQARRVEAQLASSDNDREALEKMSRLGDLLRTSNEEQLLNISFDGFEERVLNAVGQSKSLGLSERAKVWVNEFFEHRRHLWIPAASFAGAAAAILLIVPLFSKAPIVNTPLQRDNQEIWAASANTVVISGGSEVVLLSRAQTSGVEYSIKNDRGENIGVVWIND